MINAIINFIFLSSFSLSTLRKWTIYFSGKGKKGTKSLSKKTKTTKSLAYKCVKKDRCEDKGGVCKKENEECNGIAINIKCKGKKCVCCFEGNLFYIDLLNK